MSQASHPPGPLQDTVARDYARKLKTFNGFAAQELQEAIASLHLRPGMRVLDAGCGTGETLQWLAQAVAPGGLAVGLDLARAHLAAARMQASASNGLILADLRQVPLRASRWDLIWCANTIHHLPDPPHAVKNLAALLRPGGRLALGQSALLPDMYFAWDARLERLANEAVRRYYRERYGLDERDLTAVRALVGLLRGAGLRAVTVKTFVIERLAPLHATDRRYLAETIFRDTWAGGRRFEPYLETEDYAALQRLCDPCHAEFALDRPDFHFLQTFTLAVGAANPENPVSDTGFSRELNQRPSDS